MTTVIDKPSWANAIHLVWWEPHPSDEGVRNLQIRNTLRMVNSEADYKEVFNCVSKSKAIAWYVFADGKTWHRAPGAAGYVEWVCPNIECNELGFVVPDAVFLQIGDATYHYARKRFYYHSGGVHAWFLAPVPSPTEQAQ